MIKLSRWIPYPVKSAVRVSVNISAVSGLTLMFRGDVQLRRGLGDIWMICPSFKAAAGSSAWKIA
jgi:hypothetical protein